ncbi:MAG TPA: hypothetical protein VGP82_18955, partial [Ktedonobacterales bacterium]|nr:hypothetical protein [Ktedonobacterales bacterium]
VYVNAGERQVVIEDNGSGLTREEIATFLATVGRGYTSQLRTELEGAGRAEALDLIGMFGLGLLSAFMIASRIEITTESFQTPDTAWRWISEGGQSYALRRASRESVGTTVRLDLRDDAKFLLEPGTLEDILTVYAEFLTIPIVVNRGAEPINGQPAPWQQEDEAGPAQVARYMAWVETRRGVRPLTVIPLEDVTLDDGRHVPLDGVLYVPPRSIISIQEYGDVTVYVRHMLITERERDLLPEWARFVTGVIDCPLLNPTASRESLRHDEIYGAVQAALARQVLAHFEHLAESAPMDWAAVVQAHNDLIKGWAVRSPELFVHVADLVVFKTSRGQLTLPEYLHENPGRVFYYGDDDGVTQALALFEARRLAVVDARWFADVAFLRAYSDAYGVPAEELAPGAGYLFATVDDPEGAWLPLLDACRAEGYPARLLSFEPEHLPMILLYPPGAERLRRAQRNMDEGRYAGPIRRLVRGYLERQQPDEAVLKGTLHLNARNPLLRRVRDLGPEHPDFKPLLGILVANARMFAGQGLSAQDAIACFEQINRSLAQLAGLEVTRGDGRTALTVAMLTELGLHPDAARRLTTACETLEDLLAADVAVLAERTHVSTLMLATVREALKRAMAPAMNEPQDTAPDTSRDGSGVISLRERREQLREQPDEGNN